MPKASHGSPPPGLCGTCAHARVVRNRRGSVFHLCRAAADDPRLRRYPVLPVLRCHAFRPADPDRSPDEKARERGAPPGLDATGRGPDQG
jgi:hypothetical protein